MNNLTPNTDFVVRGNKGLSAVMGIAFLILFVISLTDKVDDEQQGFHFKTMYLTIVPAIYFLAKAFSQNRDIIRVNQQGFFIMINW